LSALFQFLDHPLKNRLSRCLGDRHARHEEHSAGEQINAIGRNRVAFRVARGRDMLFSRGWGSLF